MERFVQFLASAPPRALMESSTPLRCSLWNNSALNRCTSTSSSCARHGRVATRCSLTTLGFITTEIRAVLMRAILMRATCGTRVQQHAPTTLITNQ